MRCSAQAAGMMHLYFPFLQYMRRAIWCVMSLFLAVSGLFLWQVGSRLATRLSPPSVSCAVERPKPVASRWDFKRLAAYAQALRLFSKHASRALVVIGSLERLFTYTCLLYCLKAPATVSGIALVPGSGMYALQVAV